jgi:hypothetical protein
MLLAIFHTNIISQVWSKGFSIQPKFIFYLINVKTDKLLLIYLLSFDSYLTYAESYFRGCS